MKSTKKYVYGTLLALPLIGISFYVLNPPQCPLEFTQAQVDSSHCIVGANIGGIPLFVVSVPIIWLVSIWLVGKLLNRVRAK